MVSPGAASTSRPSRLNLIGPDPFLLIAKAPSACRTRPALSRDQRQAAVVQKSAQRRPDREHRGRQYSGFDNKQDSQDCRNNRDRDPYARSRDTHLSPTGGTGHGAPRTEKKLGLQRDRFFPAMWAFDVPHRSL